MSNEQPISDRAHNRFALMALGLTLAGCVPLISGRYVSFVVGVVMCIVLVYDKDGRHSVLRGVTGILAGIVAISLSSVGGPGP